MKTKEDLNTINEEKETLNEKLSSLTEEDLKQVSGGNDDDIQRMERDIVAINTGFLSVPEYIKNEIIEVYKTLGRGAAKAVAERLTKNHPTWASIVSFLK